MKVFLSWSGPLSHAVAAALHDWIPLVIQLATPFISEDIAKGRRWSNVLGEQLSESDYGIVCITKDNVAAPWLHFEAGAISKMMGKSNVSPLLLNIKQSEVDGPFSQFQLTVCEKDDIFRLMQSINGQLPDQTRLSDDLLIREFEEWWPILEEKLKQIETTNATQVDVATHTAYNWLYTTEDLARANLSKKDTQIWWITPDPFVYLLRNPLTESVAAIKDCMNRNVAFTIMIPPNAPKIEEAQDSFDYIARDKPENFQVVKISPEEFHRAAVTDYVVVDSNSVSPEVYLELPIGERGYWIYLDDAAALGIRKRFLDMKDTQSSMTPISNAGK
ncbi:MAG: hypothetical protein V7638_4417 [Acidobacteriota bacterium]|jgi:hypothetical protein